MKSIITLVKVKALWLSICLLNFPIQAQNKVYKDDFDLLPREKNQVSQQNQNYFNSISEYEYLEHVEDRGGMNIPYDGIVDEQGNTYITGAVSNSDSPEGNFATIKINDLGELEWEQIKTGTKFGVEKGQVLVLDEEGNPISSGVHWNGNDLDFYTVKYDKENGDVLWSHIYDSNHSGLDIPTAMAIDGDGNVFVAGVSYIGNEVYAYSLLKYDDSGGLLWSITDENNIQGSWSEPTSIAIDNNGNIAVTGFGAVEEEADGYWEGQITKVYDSEGDELWNDSQQVINNHSQGRSVVFDEDGNLYVTGDFGFEIGTFKYDQVGGLEWTKTYTGSSQTYAHQISISATNKIYVAGRDYNEKELILISYDDEGNENWIEKTTGLNDIQIATLELDDNEQPIISGFGKNETQGENQIIKVLNYNEDGNLIKDINYSKPYSDTENINKYIGFHINDNEVYLMLDNSYTEKGNVFEVLKIDSNSNDEDWSFIYETSNSSSMTQIQGSQNFVQDSNNNLYLISSYSKVEDLEIKTYNSLVKYSTDGEVEWEKEFENINSSVQLHINSNDEMIMVFLPRGGLINEGEQVNDPLQIKKVDVDGALLWETEKEVILKNTMNYLSHSFLDDSDNIYVVGNEYFNAENTAPYASFIKYSDSGQELWKEFHSFSSFSSTYDTYGFNASAIDSQGNIVLTGFGGLTGGMTGNPPSFEIIVLKIDSEDGSLIFYKEIEQEVVGENSGVDLLSDENDNIYITAISDDFIFMKNDVITLKLNGAGEEMWSTVYSQEEENRILFPKASYFDSNHNLIITAESELPEVNIRYTVMKFDSDDGELIWDYNSEIGHFYKDSYLDDQDNLYILNQILEPHLPYKNSDGVSAKLDKINNQGIEVEDEYFHGPELSIFNPKSLTPLNNGKLIIGGEAVSDLFFFSGLYFYETNHDLGVDDFSNDYNKDNDGLKQNYPNPFENFTTIPFELNNGGQIKIELYDIQGRKLKTLTNDIYGKGNHEIDVDLSDLSRGIYLYQLKTESHKQTLKMIVK